jgi:hypothetical protein
VRPRRQQLCVACDGTWDKCIQPEESGLERSWIFILQSSPSSPAAGGNSDGFCEPEVERRISNVVYAAALFLEVEPHLFGCFDVYLTYRSCCRRKLPLVRFRPSLESTQKTAAEQLRFLTGCRNRVDICLVARLFLRISPQPHVRAFAGRRFYIDRRRDCQYRLCNAKSG